VKHFSRAQQAQQQSIMTQFEALPTILKNDDTQAIISVDGSKSAPRPLSHKLSYRFAMDEIDADDIAKVVNESSDIECIPDGEFNYRMPGPRITAKEVRTMNFVGNSPFFLTLSL
jgi:hypothetical protein